MTVIDLPQAVDPRKNRHAARSSSETSSESASGPHHGVDRHAGRIAGDLWTGWEFAELVPEELRGLTM